MHDENCPSILYEQMNVHMSLTQWFKVEPKFYPQIQLRCVSSSLWAEPTNRAKAPPMPLHIMSRGRKINVMLRIKNPCNNYYLQKSPGPRVPTLKKPIQATNCCHTF